MINGVEPDDGMCWNFSLLSLSQYIYIMALSRMKNDTSFNKSRSRSPCVTLGADGQRWCHKLAEDTLVKHTPWTFRTWLKCFCRVVIANDRTPQISKTKQPREWRFPQLFLSIPNTQSGTGTLFKLPLCADDSDFLDERVNSWALTTSFPAASVIPALMRMT